ncbi:MAG: hypothetical protein J6C79_04450 [Clostridia bacterium]|nr:hypothetical protein [Clostridia bacterium]
MKTWKKFAALVLALGLTAGFVACGGGNDGNNGGSSNADSSSSETSSEVVGEQVSEEEFNAAVEASYAATNFMVVQTDAHGTTTSYCADGKVYSIASTDAGVISYCYMGAVDGTYYMWTSEDGELWEYEVMEFPDGFNPASGESLLAEIMQWCIFNYWEFNTTTGMFEFSTLGNVVVHAMVSGGKIVKYRYEEGVSDWREGVITYGGATVGELPPLD